MRMVVRNIVGLGGTLHLKLEQIRVVDLAKPVNDRVVRTPLGNKVVPRMESGPLLQV